MLATMLVVIWHDVSDWQRTCCRIASSARRCMGTLPRCPHLVAALTAFSCLWLVWHVCCIVTLMIGYTLAVEPAAVGGGGGRYGWDNAPEAEAAPVLCGAASLLLLSRRCRRRSGEVADWLFSIAGGPGQPRLPGAYARLISTLSPSDALASVLGDGCPRTPVQAWKRCRRWVC